MEPYVIQFPDVYKLEMEFILSLLYSGTTNIYKDELASIVSLTSLLKMVSIPVVLTEETWDTRRQITSTSVNVSSSAKAIINFFPTGGKKRRGRPGKFLSSQKQESGETVLNTLIAEPEPDLAPSLRFTGVENLEPGNHSEDPLQDGICNMERLIFL